MVYNVFIQERSQVGIPPIAEANGFPANITMKFKTMLTLAVLFYIGVYFTAKVLQSFHVLTVGDWGVE